MYKYILDTNEHSHETESEGCNNNDKRTCTEAALGHSYHSPYKHLEFNSTHFKCFSKSVDV